MVKTMLQAAGKLKEIINRNTLFNYRANSVNCDSEVGVSYGSTTSLNWPKCLTENTTVKHVAATAEQYASAGQNASIKTQQWSM